MSLGNQYRVKTERSQFVDHLGVERTTLVFEIPTANIALERANFRASLDNILPGHDSGDVFAPCIHESFVNIDPENRKGKLVTCIYQRPSEGMILIPGRGLLEHSSYDSLRIEEIGVLEHSEIAWDENDGVVAASDTPLAGAPTQSIWDKSEPVSERWILKRERQQIIDVRSVLITKVVDLASIEGTIFARAIDWLGKGGKFTIKGVKYENLKCMRVEIRRRPANVAWMDSRWYFAKREEAWPVAEIIEPEYYGVSMPSGTEIEDFDPGALASDRGPYFGFGNPPEGSLAAGDTGWMAIALRNQENDVISGDADFSAIASYFTWEVSS
jgi:hypothetical protein